MGLLPIKRVLCLPKSPFVKGSAGAVADRGGRALPGRIAGSAVRAVAKNQE